MLCFTGFLSVAAFYITNRGFVAVTESEGLIADRINGAFRSIASNPLYIGTSKGALLMGITGAAIIWLIWLYNVFDRKNLMRGKEHGTARWGNHKDIKPFIDPIPDNNIPLSSTEQISLKKSKSFETDRNKNIVVVGGSGSGKSFSLVKPSLMQCHSSYVITDPKGTLLPDTGTMLVNNGYTVCAFNTVDFSKSLHYNPLAYIHSEKDILKIVNVLIENTQGEGERSTEKFWVDCERLLYTALIAYLREEAPAEEQNIPMMIEMLDYCKVSENDENYQSPIDIIFEDLEREKPNCLAVKQYKKFKHAAGKTMKSILISCAARLAPFDIGEVREIFSYDELHLDEIGDRKTALFLIMSDTDSTYAFCIAMIMYQMFNLLCEKADNEYGGKLPVHVRCLLDEFANIGKIPDFDRLIATIRSREISCMVILQSLSQLNGPYRDKAEIIIDCCDTFVFLGGKSQKTTETISKEIGKGTIDTIHVTESRGQSGSFSMQSSSLGRDLLDPAEIARLKRTECIVSIVGVPPFRSQKFNTSGHKRFCEIVDGGAPVFDIRKIKRPPEEDENIEIIGDIEVSEISLSELNELI